LAFKVARMGLRGKLLSMAGILVVLCFGTASILLINQARNTIDAQATDYATVTSRSYANQLKSSYDAGLDSARALGQTMEWYIASTNGANSREDVIAMLKHLADSNPNLVGVYVGFEPNAFDNQDANYRTSNGYDAADPAKLKAYNEEVAAKPQLAGHDPSGRFVPYWNRIGGQLNLTPLTDYDKVGAGDYYQIPKQRNKESVIDPYLYQGALLTSLVVPIRDSSGKFAGIAGVDLDLYPMVKSLASVKLYDTGYLSVVSNNGSYVSHPNPMVVGYSSLNKIDVDTPTKALTDSSSSLAAVAKSSDGASLKLLAEAQSGKEMAAQMEKVVGDVKAGKEGQFEETIGGKPTINFYTPIAIGTTGTPWSVVVSVPTEEVAAPINRMVQTGVLVTFTAIVLIVGLLGFIITRSLRPLAGLTQAAKAVAQGDLDQKIVVTGTDEISRIAQGFEDVVSYARTMAGAAERISQGDLSQTVRPRSEKDTLGVAFQRMIGNLRDMVGSVSSSARALAQASDQLSSASEQAGAATDQIATTIQQVARGNQDQSSAVQDTTESVEQLSKAIDQIARGSQEQAKSVQKAAASVAQLNTSVVQAAAASKQVSAAAQQAHLAATSGGETVKKTAQGMVAIKTSTSTVASRIQELEGYSEQIGSIVEAIDDIAEQTNLLALNAAIEAARAGEHGRGFAVVADEVRKLAERSSRETKQIADLISHVQKGTREAVAATEQGAREVESGFQLAEQAGKALGDILAAAQDAARQAENIAQAVSGMEAASQQVVTIMDSVSAVVEESTATTQEMAASSQQVTGAIEKVAAVSEETSAAAEEVSASTEEMSAQVEEVVALSQNLAQMAQQLQEAVSQFQTGESAEPIQRRRKDDWQGAALNGTQAVRSL
jgi:methyl-accepting chemotaxis protein